jgi:hypothetical protein
MLLIYIHICEAIRIKILHFESKNIESEGQNRNSIFIFFKKKSLLKFVTEILELFLDNGMTNIPALTGREAIAV